MHAMQMSGVAKFQLCRLILALLCVWDLMLSTFLSLWAGEGEIKLHKLKNQISQYNFGVSPFDLWLISIFRSFLCFVLTLSFCCAQKTPLRLTLKHISPAFILISAIFVCFFIAKLLTSFEYYSDGTPVHGDKYNSTAANCLCLNSSSTPTVSNHIVQPHHPWLWLLLAWMVLCQILYAILYQILVTVTILPQKMSKDFEQARNSVYTPLLSAYGSIQISRDISENSLREDSVSTSSSNLNQVTDGHKSKHINSVFMMWRMIKYCKHEWHWFTVGFTLLVISSVGMAFIPYYTGQIINHIAIQPSMAEFQHAIIIMCGIIVICAVSAGLRSCTTIEGYARVMIRIRKDLFKSILDQEIAFFDETETGDLISRLTSDTTQVANQFGLNINILMRNGVTFLVSLIFMFHLTWKLSTLTLVGIPMITLITKYFGVKIKDNGKDIQDSFARANCVAEEAISSMRTVRSFANEVVEHESFGDKLKQTLIEYSRKGKIYGTWNMLTNLMELLLQVLTLYYGGHLVIHGEITGGELVSLMLYQTALSAALDAMGNVITNIMSAFGAADKVFELIDRDPKIDHKSGSYAPDKLDGLVEFKNVCFSYPSRQDILVLKNISFTAQPGEVVALVGPSGSGKSTCISLLERFYEPTSGYVLLDGQNLTDYQHSYLHTKISMVGQEPVLYGRSVGENITCGLKDVGQDDIEHTARLANAHSFICGMTRGYHTQTGEKGSQLSGGQKQRVAIARALIRKPTVLLLDEATSALDAESEHLVQQALNQNFHGKTVIIIAHRLSTVEKADKIVVLDKGTILEEGTHQELLRKGGLYSNLVKKQMVVDDTT